MEVKQVSRKGDLVDVDVVVNYGHGGGGNAVKGGRQIQVWEKSTSWLGGGAQPRRWSEREPFQNREGFVCVNILV